MNSSFIRWPLAVLIVVWFVLTTICISKRMEPQKDRSQCFTTAYDQADAWWNLPRDRLERFIREQWSLADYVEVAVIENGREIERLRIDDKAELQSLSGSFRIISGPKSADIFAGIRTTRMEVAGAATIHLVLISDSCVQFGPWGSVTLEGTLDPQLFPSLWHRVEVSEEFYKQLRERVGLPLF